MRGVSCLVCTALCLTWPLFSLTSSKAPVVRGGSQRPVAESMDESKRTFWKEQQNRGTIHGQGEPLVGQCESGLPVCAPGAFFASATCALRLTDALSPSRPLSLSQTPLVRPRRMWRT